MSEDLDRQAIVDEEHLKLLVLGYRIAGGINLFMALLGLLYLVLGLAFALALPRTALPAAHGQPAPAMVGWVLGILGLVFLLFTLGLAALKFWVASCLKAHRRRTFCQVVAAFTCLGIPYGTALGACTFIVLSRPSVRERFQSENRTN